MTLSNLVDQTTALPGDDKTLAEAASSDHAAFDALYRRYVHRVYRYCFTHTHNAPDAEDLTAVIALQAKPCGRVVNAVKRGEDDYVATCEDGNRYHVYVRDGRVIVEKIG